MTLIEMITMYPGLFYPQQWYIGEAFTKAPLPTWPHKMPTELIRGAPCVAEASATTLAALYIEHPTDPIWRDYLWTSDVDAQGQRVYVGGTANGKGFEIHRHLHLTARWSTPVWN